ncbi:hypothetical protein OIO90_000399 [Microbotryomycetes sp. JL221]|nr:hypothetical protein OIO90_000399 [Microbotryomycetes sp. JL221]
MVTNPFASTNALNEDVVDPLAVSDVTVLPSDPQLSIDELVPILRARFLEGQPYTNVSSRIVVAVNPNQHVLANSDDVLQDWTTEFDDCGNEGVRGRLQPHLWSLSNRAYYNMRRTGQDQSIIVSGESGSGKTEATRLLLRSLIDLSVQPTGKKGSKLANSIPAAVFILDSFGNAAAVHNSNASRFGRYLELQFSDKGRLVGLKGLEYFIEKSRVTTLSAGERTFHAMYYLVAGATSDERSYLNLHDLNAFRYLPNMRLSDPTNLQYAGKFAQLKEAFRAVGFPKKAVAAVFQMLAAILHLGNLEFVIDRTRNLDSAVVKNVEVLEIVANFLGVQPSHLESALTVKSPLINGEVYTIFLNVDAAAANRDDLARALYGLLFGWIAEFLNEKLCRDDFATFVGLIEFPGLTHQTAGHRDGANFEAFCFNLASERIHHFVLDQLYEVKKSEYKSEGLDVLLTGYDATYKSNAECIRLLTNQPGGLVHIVDDQSKRPNKTDATMLKAMTKRWGSHASFQARDGDASLGIPGTFAVTHWDGNVTYSVENFLEDNSIGLSPNFVSLLGGTQHGSSPRDGTTNSGSTISFVRQLFSSEAVQVKAHPRSNSTIVEAQQKVAPRRAPSTKRRARGANPFSDIDGIQADDDDNAPNSDEGRSVITEVNESLTLLLSTLASTKTWNVLCLRPNDSQLPNQVDSRLLKHQVRSLGLSDLVKRLKGEWSVNLEHKEWWERYKSTPMLTENQQSLAPLTYRDKVLKAKEVLSFSQQDMAVGKNKVFLSDDAFRVLEDVKRAQEPEQQQRVIERTEREASRTPDRYSPYALPETNAFEYSPEFSRTTSTAALPLVNYNGDGFEPSELDFDRKTFWTEGDDNLMTHSQFDDERAIGVPPVDSPRKSAQFNEKAPLGPEGIETVEEVKDSRVRRRWVAFVWFLTWWIPSPILRSCGRMKRTDVRMAWREKLVINMLIWLLCGAAVFVIAILGNLICPREYVYSSSELNDHSFTNAPDNMLVAIRGEIFDLTSFAPRHQPGNSVIPTRSIQRYGGTDVTDLFPVQVSALCNGVDGTVSPWVTLESSNTTNDVSQYHDFRAYSSDSRPDWYAETMIYLRYNFRKGFVGYTPGSVRKMGKSGKNIVIYDGGVYDMSQYIQSGGGGVRVPDGATPPAGIDRNFMQSDIVALFRSQAGNDVTTTLDSLNLDPDILARQKVCLRNLFFAGKVDNRNSAQCQFSQWILIALSVFMAAIIGFKFLAALQFGRKRKPEDYDKFVICQVPCYTEGEESLRNCLDSLTKLKYDDKRKLLFVICDGNIVGSGNDRPTPSIVLDILGADPSLDPEPLSFQSIGDGAKQHNMAKIYSGLYEAAGHIVPYLVVVKVGKPTERSRPGNRGKRDSQMLLLRFLNRVHFDSPMAPAELEIYHQIKNVIGVNPSFYEYLFMIDADTVVDPTSLNYLVGSCVQDKKVVGICGETSLSNAKASWTTMMQVYEYFISHHLAKAFESLFGSVTCLPGCFCMYRVRSLEHKPLIIADSVITEYGENKVETLHVKNLLSLGEDRYLTTLMLKNFPQYKMKFCPDAHAKTIAPDDWKVLMSQRRRWINSTIHNLMELVFIDKLCGFCCFSMRFIVFIDLLSTLIAPVTVAYIVYLIYLVVGENKPIPTFALILIGVVYGCQIVIYILHRRFEHIGWMILYILAIPFFSFVLPLVSFWQMDDFSWGATREIIGEKGKRMVVHDEGAFDPACIPLKTWQDFENELWEQGSNRSIGEIVASKQEEAGGDDYGYELPYTDRPESPRSRLYEHQSQFGGSSQALATHRFGSHGSLYDATMSAGGQQPMSFYGAGASSEYVARPPSTAFSSSPRPMSPFNMPGLPDDHHIVMDVQNILATADLSTLTKKQVRQELEERYGMPLGDRKMLVNQTIETHLGL